MMVEESNSKQPDSRAEFSYRVAAKLKTLIDMSASCGRPLTRGQDQVVPSTAITGGERVLVALSGGPDSTSLLHALAQRATDFGLSLAACHINHHTRGGESDEDEKFCEILCSKLNVKLYIRHVSLAKLKARPSEAMLRDARYSLLLDVASQSESHFIALAHTLDDQTETVLFRLFRGSSMSGVLGMLPLRYLNKDVAIVRPMLSFTRAQCFAYLNVIGVSWRDDLSNQDERYTRNYLRRVIVPLINKRFPGFARRVANFCAIAKAEGDLLSKIANESLAHLRQDNDCRWSLAQFLALPLAIKRRVLALYMWEHNIEVDFERVEKILWLTDLASREKAIEMLGYRDEFFCQLPERSEKLALSLNQSFDIRVEREEIVWVDKNRKPLKLANDFRLKVPGITPIPQLGLALKVEEWSNAAEPNYPEEGRLASFVDLSGTSLPLIFRNRRPGDVIQPFGMKEKVKLKKYLHTHKRRSAMKLDSNRWEYLADASVVVADQDEVVWVPGRGLSEKVRVQGQPTHKFQWIEIAADELDLA